VGIAGRSGLKLDLGCGATKVGADYLGVDAIDGPAVDLVGDVIVILRSLPDGCADEIYSSHLFEHIDDLAELVAQVERVLSTGGRLRVVVPHFSNAYYYSDPTHRRPFGLYTFSYFADDPVLHRRVPKYGHVPRLRIESVSLHFRSSVEFRHRYRVKAAVGRLFNANTWLMEFYEENLTGLFPCYELRFELLKVP
jgi:SAM-dependent methyltransferase